MVLNNKEDKSRKLYESITIGGIVDKSKATKFSDTSKIPPKIVMENDIERKYIGDKDTKVLNMIIQTAIIAFTLGVITMGIIAAVIFSLLG
jgi:hypothetical protein